MIQQNECIWGRNTNISAFQQQSSLDLGGFSSLEPDLESIKG